MALIVAKIITYIKNIPVTILRFIEFLTAVHAHDEGLMMEFTRAETPNESQENSEQQRRSGEIGNPLGSGDTSVYQPHESISIFVQKDVAKSENRNESFTVICMEKKPSEVHLPIERQRPTTANAHGDSAINTDLNINCILNIDCIESTDLEIGNFSAFENNSRTKLVGYMGHERTWLDRILLRCYFFCCCEYI